jgi:hypothetical protein
LVAWAKRTGRVYLRIIQGCYHKGLSASAGTHDGGGVYDVEMDGYSRDEAIMSTNEGRKEFLITEDRWWGSNDKPNHHIHLIDPECPNLSQAAMDQVEEYRRGETGLVGNDPDTYYRGNKVEMLRRYDARKGSTSRTYTISKGGTLGAAAVALGVSLSALVGYNHISNPNVVQPGTVVTAPPATYTAPAKPKPTATAKPVVKAAPKPVSKPKPVVNVKPKPKPAPKHAAPKKVSRVALKPGKTNASVKAYETALWKRGYLAKRYVDGYYGTATSAGTKALYRHLGWTPNATIPGPGLLQVLHLSVTR